MEIGSEQREQGRLVGADIPVYLYVVVIASGEDVKLAISIEISKPEPTIERRKSELQAFEPELCGLTRPGVPIELKAVVIVIVDEEIEVSVAIDVNELMGGVVEAASEWMFNCESSGTYRDCVHLTAERLTFE